MNEKESVLGKSEIVTALIEEGFNEDEASRAYEILLDELERGLRDGRTLYFRRIFKIWPKRMPPRRYWDNWNKKHIYFGERVMLKIKPFFLKDRNLPTGRKIRAGRRAKGIEPQTEISLPKTLPPPGETAFPITRKQLGKADRALKKLGLPLPSLAQKEELVRYFLNRGIDPAEHTSPSLAKQIRAQKNINNNGTDPEHRSSLENGYLKDARLETR
jgi:hypothetical protein